MVTKLASTTTAKILDTASPQHWITESDQEEVLETHCLNLTLRTISIGEDTHYDLTFYIVIIILLLNLIFGIIIDAFADLRDQRNEVKAEVKEKCFICGLTASTFESKKISFLDHVSREHNVYSYIYYIIYLSSKPPNECTGIEKYV